MYDFFDFLNEKEQDRIREIEVYSKTDPLDNIKPRYVGDLEEKARKTISKSAYADTTSEKPEELEEPSFDWEEFGKDALGSLGSQGGRPQSLGSTSPRSGPAVPQGSTRFSPTPEPIQYGVPLEVLTNIQLRAQTEAYLRNLYDQAMRERIRRPNVISLI